MLQLKPVTKRLLCLVAAATVALAAAAGCAREEPADSADAIHATALPAEAREVIARIRQGGPYRFERDDSVFYNREGLLPKKARGYYREYTVPTPGISSRGARRIVKGASGELYYTADHYRSFKRVRE